MPALMSACRVVWCMLDNKKVDYLGEAKAIPHQCCNSTCMKMLICLHDGILCQLHLCIPALVKESCRHNAEPVSMNSDRRQSASLRLLPPCQPPWPILRFQSPYSTLTYTRLAQYTGLNLWIHLQGVIAFHATSRFTPFPRCSGNISLYKP